MSLIVLLNRVRQFASGYASVAISSKALLWLLTSDRKPAAGPARGHAEAPPRAAGAGFRGTGRTRGVRAADLGEVDLGERFKMRSHSQNSALKQPRMRIGEGLQNGSSEERRW